MIKILDIIETIIHIMVEAKGKLTSILLLKNNGFFKDIKIIIAKDENSSFQWLHTIDFTIICEKINYKIVVDHR